MRIRSIPPITSTGNKVRNPSAPLAGLANISLGRYMSEMKRKQESDENNDSSWNFDKHTKSDFNKKSNKKESSPFVDKINETIECIVDTINGDDNVTINLKLIGVTPSGEFEKLSDNQYIIPATHNNKEMYLQLKTTGDIFECEVIGNKDGTNRIFDNEIHIPDLLDICKKSCMDVSIKDEIIVVKFKK